MRLRLAGHVAKIEEKNNTCGVSLIKPERKRPLGIARRRFGYNTKLKFVKI
jgi:hypothetical protein